MDKRDKNKNILVKFICAMLSFALWIYICNVENPMITKTIKNVSVILKNTDSLEGSKLVLMPNQDFKVNIEVQGTASDVYSLKPSDFELSADLSYYALKKGDNNILVNVNKSPEKITVKRTDALKVTVALDELGEKTLPIKVDVNVTAKDGYYPAVPSVNPQNAYVSGAASYVNRVESIVAKGSAKDVEDDVSITTNLVALDKNGSIIKDVTINPVTADVSIAIKKVKTVSVNAITTGVLKSNLLMKSISVKPESIEISGDEGILSTITSIDTEPVNLSLITESKTIAVKLKVPKGITIRNNPTGTVNLNFVVEGIVKKDINVPISLIGLKEDLKSSLSASNVTINVQGTSENMNSIKDIKGIIDATSMTKGEYNVVPDIKLPSGITLNSMIPENVTVTIEEKDIQTGGNVSGN